VSGVFSASPDRAGFDRLGVQGQLRESRAVTPVEPGQVGDLLSARFGLHGWTYDAGGRLTAQ